jgi:glycosyltransferase involved in cell wall biosynthesis
VSLWKMNENVNNKQYFVSVIMPVHNGEIYLTEAIENIRRQDYKSLEIIIVDDGSTDNTAKIAADFQDLVHYLYQPNTGPAAARNRGLLTAKGDVIGFLDVDDLWSENKLKLQLEHLNRIPSPDVVLGHTQRMQLIEHEKGNVRFKEWSGPVLVMHVGSALFRKSVFEKVGLFNESLGYCEDWDWFMRAKEMNVPMVVHKEVTYYYRRHDQNMTNDSEATLKSALKVLRQSLNRRRQEGGGTVVKLPQLSDFISDSEQLLNRNRVGKDTCGSHE